MPSHPDRVRANYLPQAMAEGRVFLISPGAFIEDPDDLSILHVNPKRLGVITNIAPPEPIDPAKPQWVGDYYFEPEMFKRAYRNAYENHVNPDANTPVSRIPDGHDPFCPPVDPLLDLPKHERRQYGVRSVRQWFREMRAEDFKRDVAKASSDAYGALWWVPSDLRPWSLFDTMQVVERETERFYDDKFDEVTILVHDRGPKGNCYARVPRTPSVAAWFRDLWAAQDDNDDDAIGRIHARKPWRIGADNEVILADVEPAIERSETPIFSSKVPEASARLMFEDVHRMIEDVCVKAPGIPYEKPVHVQLAPWLQHHRNCGTLILQPCDCGLNRTLRELRGDPASPPGAGRGTPR